MKEGIRKRLVEAALAIAFGAAGGVATYFAAQQPSEAVILAMELGSHYESSGRHIGTPYVDRLGKGQPLTVCNGVTGPEVAAGRTYSREDCKRLELAKYIEAERLARVGLKHWDGYNVWVRVSLIDMVYNLGPSVLDGTTLVRLGNSGNLVGMCEQMPRRVRGTANGQSVVLRGLQDRRAVMRELCAVWGRDGHFSAGLISEAQP